MTNKTTDFIGEVDSTRKPPMGKSYGIYFTSINTTLEESEAFITKIKAYSTPLSSQHMGIWSRSDARYFDVLKAFNITDLPAFVFTKPWRGKNVGGLWDWNNNPFMMAQLSEHNQMPVHCVLQGDAVFEDEKQLLNIIEKLSVLFGTTKGEDLAEALRNRKIFEMVNTAFQNTKNLLKNLALTFGVGPFSVKLSYDKDGVEASFEEKEKDSEDA